MATLTVLQLIDQLDECIGRNDTVSSLRAKLGPVREQVEALEARVEVFQARIEELEAKIKQTQLGAEQDGFDEDAEKIVDFLFDNDSIILPMVARRLGIEKGMAQYHADNLSTAGMIELYAMTPGGPMFGLTQKGRAHAAKRRKK
jgi:hypothetical protein